MADFEKINRSQWAREEYFAHYFSQVPCTYSMTVSVDITSVRKRGLRLYPTMLYVLAQSVNRHSEFRAGWDQDGELGVFTVMHPSYTVFHQDTETFSNLWTEYTPSYPQFCAAYAQDIRTYGKIHRMEPKPDTPPNSFPVSMLPWVELEGFHLDLEKGFSYLTPIFTMGKFREEAGRILLPLSVQVHHAVCDGFHVSRLILEVRQALQECRFAECAEG